MSLPTPLAQMLEELPTRLQRAQENLAQLDDIASADDPAAWLTGLAQIAADVDFVQDIAATVPLFLPHAHVPVPSDLMDRLQGLGRDALHWCAANPHPDFVPYQQWLQDFAKGRADPSLPQDFVHFLNNFGFAYDGFDVALMDIWQLLRIAPENVTADLRRAFSDQGEAIADGLAACLNAAMTEDQLYQQVLATPLKLSPQEVQRARAYEVPEHRLPCARAQLQTWPADILDAAYDHLCQSNISGPDCKAIFDAGHVLIGPPGPDFSFTVQPDRARPPIIYVPFTGQANDITLLCHQLGHGLHLWRAAQQSVAPVRLLPVMDEIIPSFFETHAAAILSKLTDQPDQGGEKWHDDLQRYQMLARLCETARAGALTGAQVLRDAGDLFDLIFAAQLFPALPLSSSAWGHMVAAQYQRAGGGEERLLNVIAPQGANVSVMAVFDGAGQGGIPGNSGMPFN